MSALTLTASPDPEVWVHVPATYPDARGADPAEWGRSVAADFGPADDLDRFALLMEDLAESEMGRGAGVAFVFLPEDLGTMAKVRLHLVPTEALTELEVPGGPLEPAEDRYEATNLGVARRSVTAGRAHPDRDDLLVTVTYRWDLGEVTLLLVMTTLDPGQAIAMLDELDAFADDLHVTDEDGAPVRARTAGGDRP